MVSSQREKKRKRHHHSEGGGGRGGGSFFREPRQALLLLREMAQSLSAMPQQKGGEKRKWKFKRRLGRQPTASRKKNQALPRQTPTPTLDVKDEGKVEWRERPSSSRPVNRKKEPSAFSSPVQGGEDVGGDVRYAGKRGRER